MSIGDIARQDFTSARRSRALWAVGAVVAVLATLIVYVPSGYRLSPAGMVRQSFGRLAMVLSILLPIVALVASYMAIAGERESGGIRFLLSFPNTRRDVFLGKLASRLAVVGAIVGGLFIAATSIAVARHGALPLAVVVGLGVLSLLYSSVFVCIAVALSAAVSSRARAIGAAMGSYFVLVVLYVVPLVKIPSIVRWLHHTMLGFEPNQHLYDAVTYTSPFVAFRKAMNLFFPADMQQVVFRRSAEQAAELPVYLTDPVSLVVFAVWIIIPLGLGYRRFVGADLE